MRINKLRIGLDIDDCLADFWSAYCNYFDTDNNPKMLQDSIITWNVQNILKKDKDFWINLPVLNRPDFIPELYCTKRVNNKEWTRLWLELNDFPIRPIYQMYYQHGNKADLIKGRVDVFVDDSLSNVVKMNKSGVTAVLYHTDRTADIPFYKTYSITKDGIIDAYKYIQQYGY